MKKSILVLLLILNLQGMSQKPFEGEYYFRKTEMVAGFNFSATGTFQFFFSYGAVDRNATGTFLVKDNIINLTSSKEAGKDFTVTSQAKKTGGYNLTFTNPDKYLVQHVLCVFFINGQKQEVASNKKGEVHVDLAHCDSIYVQHLLYPDILTLVKDASNSNNNFAVALNPSLEQVSFKGIDFKIENDKEISCFTNYFLPMQNIRFVKKD